MILQMIRPWTWTKTWNSPVSRAALREVVENVEQELQRYDYSERDFFRCRLRLEESLVGQLHAKSGADESGNIEIMCGGTIHGFQLYVAGQLRYDSEESTT
jgi:hypothetical protein